LSVEAVHDSEIDEDVEPVTVSPVGTEGLVVSTQGAVEVVTDVLVDLLPEGSKASTATV
jgi:hypothetical protein